MTITSSSVTPQIICDIITQTLGISTDQVWIYNQRRSIPEDTRMYCIVGLMSVQPYSNQKHQEVISGLQYDSMTTHVQETITIDLISYTTEAIERYPFILMSLRSTYSQQIQEQLGLKIAEVPLSISDVSAIEGATLIYRVSMTLQVLRKYDMMFKNEFYSTFPLDPVLGDL